MSHHLHRLYARHAAAVWELEARILRARGQFRAPQAAQWIATRACNLSCGHCYSHAGHRHPDELTTEEAFALIDALVEMGCPDLVIAGGEPLIRPDLAEIVGYAVSRGIRWSLHTHGGLVARNRALFERHPPALAAVSLDGPRAVHDAFRGRAGSFDAALQAVEILCEIAEDRDDAQVVIGTTVTSRNADLLADLAETVMESPADSWGLHLFAPEGRGAEHTQLLPSPRQLRQVAALVRRLRRRMDVDLDNEWGSAGSLDPFFRDQPYLCGAGRFTFVVGVDGAIMPCTTTDPAEAEGNIRTDSLPRVWRTGFGRFRGDSGGICSNGADCWLQTRNGNSCRKAAFGGDLPPEPLPTLSALQLKKRAKSPSSRRSVRAMALAAVVAALSAPVVHAGDVSFPESFNPTQWAAHQSFPDDQPRLSIWKQLKGDHLADRPHTPSPQLQTLSAVLQTHHTLDAAVLLAALEEAEAINAWDPWLVQQIWRRSGVGTVQDLTALYHRLERHARMVDALILTVAETGPVVFLPWRKKSSPPEGYTAFQVPEGLLEAARDSFARADAGTWRHEAVLECSVTTGTLTLYRQGQSSVLAAGQTVRISRLDVVVLDGTLTCGEAVVVDGSSRPLTSRTLHAHMSYSAAEQLEAQVSAAMQGDEAALGDLEPALPLAHLIIRQQLAATPDAPGAAALRQLLVLFDE